MAAPYWADDDYYKKWLPKIPDLLDKEKFPFLKDPSHERPYNLYNIKFKGQEGYIENSIGLEKCFKIISNNPDFCILWIPYDPAYFDRNTIQGGSLSTFYTDVENATYFLPENRDAILQLIAKFVFKIDIALQWGINYIDAKNVNKILNSYSRLSDKDLDFTSNYPLDNYQEDNSLTFLDGYQGVIGWNFTFPINFRIMFNNYNYNYLEYSDFKTFPPFKNLDNNMAHFLLVSNQEKFFTISGLKYVQGLTKPSDEKLSDPKVAVLWYGNERGDDICDFTGQEIWRPVEDKGLNLSPQYGVYTPTADKYVFEQLFTADVNNKLNYNLLDETSYVILTLMRRGNPFFIKAYVEPTEMAGIFYFNFNNLNIFIENIPKRKTFFMSIDNTSPKIGDVGYLPFDYNLDLLKKDVNMLLYSDTSNYLNYSSSNYPEKNNFIYTIFDHVFFEDIKIVFKGEKSCIQINIDNTKFQTSNNSFTYCYKKFDKNDFLPVTEFFTKGKQTGGVISGGIKGGVVKV